MVSDTRWVYGASCPWFGPIEKVGKTGLSTLGCVSLPCCPGCDGMLYEMPSRLDWDEQVAEHAKLHPGYASMMDWLEKEYADGRHFKTAMAAQSAYETETGNMLGSTPRDGDTAL